MTLVWDVIAGAVLILAVSAFLGALIAAVIKLFGHGEEDE
jgi:hypothetical protein